MRRFTSDAFSLGLVLLSLLLLPVMLSGCSPAAMNQFNRFAIVAPPATAPTAPDNRLLVQGLDGNLFTIRPDGSGRFPITTDAGPNRNYQQPTWGPTGDRIAWAQITLNDAVRESAIVTSRFDGSDRQEQTAPFPPFYLFWSPTGENLAYLSNWAGLDGPTMALRMLELASGRTTTVAEGSPYYFSWAPNGDQLLAHIGSNRLEIQSASGQRQALRNTAAAFAAPQWAPDGTQLVYAVDEAGRQSLVVAQLDNQAAIEITSFDARISFLMSPDGKAVAYALTLNDASANTLGPLYVAEVDSLRTRELADKPVWAFYWSPDSRKLAYLATETSDETVWLRWYVWDGKRTTAYGRFLPTRTVLQSYLVFSDQYAQSMRLWSPDSTAFVYAGINEQEEIGVFVQELDQEQPRRVAAGVVAAWSPR